ncbi:hybrid sensory kinase in two-component regulatory system with RcsB and YojN [compost metagenome]
MRGMLLKLGFRVRTADSDAMALEHLQQERFDAVLIDYLQRSQEEVSLCCQIRDMSGYAEVPLFMIALGMDRERCPTGALIDYLSKPVKFEDLQAALYRRVLCIQQGESADS